MAKEHCWLVTITYNSTPVNSEAAGCAAGAANDHELAQHAAALMAIIDKEDPNVARTIGVDLKDFEAANVTLRHIKARGTTATGVRLHEATVRGDITIEGVLAEGADPK